MNEAAIVYAPKIQVSGIVLSRQTDGSYTAEYARKETTLVEPEQERGGKWTHRNVTVPWDMRVGQEWLRMWPKAWTPVLA